MSQNIAVKVVVITGASSGRGEAAARLPSPQGAHVVPGLVQVQGDRYPAHLAARVGR